MDIIEALARIEKKRVPWYRRTSVTVMVCHYCKQRITEGHHSSCAFLVIRNFLKEIEEKKVVENE